MLMTPNPPKDELSCCSKGGALPQILASRLAAKLRRNLPPNALIVGIVGGGSELSDKIASELKLASHNLCLRTVSWPPLATSEDREVIGAISGCTDIIHLDHGAVQRAGVSTEHIMTHVQRVKLDCMHEAVSKGITIMDKHWEDKTILLTCCPHACAPMIEAALQVIRLKSPQKPCLVIPFLSQEIRKTFQTRVSSFVAIKEFEKNSACEYSEELARLNASELKASLEKI